MNGGGGDDTLIGGAGGDSLTGGTGSGDWADYTTAFSGVTANLASGGTGGDAAGDTYSTIENLRGSDLADRSPATATTTSSIRACRCSAPTR